MHWSQPLFRIDLNLYQSWREGCHLTQTSSSSDQLHANMEALIILVPLDHRERYSNATAVFPSYPPTDLLLHFSSFPHAYPFPFLSTPPSHPLILILIIVLFTLLPSPACLFLPGGTLAGSLVAVTGWMWTKQQSKGQHDPTATQPSTHLTHTTVPGRLIDPGASSTGKPRIPKHPQSTINK